MSDLLKWLQRNVALFSRLFEDIFYLFDLGFLFMILAKEALLLPLLCIIFILFLDKIFITLHLFCFDFYYWYFELDWQLPYKAHKMFISPRGTLDLFLFWCTSAVETMMSWFNLFNLDDVIFECWNLQEIFMWKWIRVIFKYTINI